MSFELPNLDRKSYQQLVAELLRRIPQYTRLWTDYNDSDPGITLLQMLAWVDESLLYQANVIPVQTEQNYLRWVLGLAFSSNITPYSRAAIADFDVDFQALQQALADMEQGASFNYESLQKDVLSYVSQPYMALTLSNIVTLALQTNRMIARQHAVPTNPPTTPPLLVRQAYAETTDQASTAYILSDAKTLYQSPAYPNHEYGQSTTIMRKLLMVQISGAAATSSAEKTLLKHVAAYLDPRIVAGNQIRVRPAFRTDINLTLNISCQPNTRLDVTITLLFAILFRYFLPCADKAGAVDGGGAAGWAYNEAPQADTLRNLILNVPGIAAINGFDFNFIPTLQLDVMATLDVNAQLADLPAGTPAMQYRGLPRLRCLDITGVAA
jgi:hypothetical protein